MRALVSVCVGERKSLANRPSPSYKLLLNLYLLPVLSVVALRGLVWLGWVMLISSISMHAALLINLGLERAGADWVLP
jgi:hypothetical protein